jgi:hypothetical protein
MKFQVLKKSSPEPLTYDISLKQNFHIPHVHDIVHHRFASENRIPWRSLHEWISN